MEGSAPGINPGQVSRHLITSIDSLVDGGRECGIVPMLLRPGPFRAELLRAKVGAVQVETVSCSAPLAFRGRTIGDRVWLVFPLDRTGGGQLNGELLTSGWLLAFAGSLDVAGATGARLRCCALSIPADALERAAVAFGVNPPVPAEGQVRVIPDVHGPALSRALDVVFRTVPDRNRSPLRILEDGAVEQVFLHIVLGSLGATSRRRGRGPSARLSSARVVRGCEDYALDRRYHNVTLTDLGAEAGVSIRRVRSAFYDCYQMSPTAYLRLAALHAARGQLLHGAHGPDPVSRAAADWGFWHLSRFAAQYRALFGELPSQTVAERMGHTEDAAAG